MITKKVIERYHLFTLFKRKLGVTLVSALSSAIRNNLFMKKLHCRNLSLIEVTSESDSWFLLIECSATSRVHPQLHGIKRTMIHLFYDIDTIYQILVSSNPLKGYRNAFQWLHSIISVRPQDYGAHWWRKQIAEFAGHRTKQIKIQKAKTWNWRHWRCTELDNRLHNTILKKG